MASSKLKALGDAVIFQHSLFSLPFAIAAVLLESGGRPGAWKFAWIIVAVLAGRNMANALNRIIDADIDAANPRTASRHLPSGSLSSRDLWILVAVTGAILVVAAAMLGWICVLLLPLAGIMVFGYSFTKRFTWLCHYWLGATCGLAVMGSFIALTGRIFELRYFALWAAVALWVAGFDIIYALQDIEIDRAQGLHSVPERFGQARAQAIAALSHLIAAALLGTVPLFWPRMGAPYWVGAGIAAALIASEHIVSRGGTERHIKIAAYSINEIVPLVVLASVIVDLYIH
jgi:4-hydroxybenzoate polyprenyltransferase